MVSEAEAKEIAGEHVDRIVGGPETGYAVVEAEAWDLEGYVTVDVDVWKVPEERDDPSRYVVEVGIENGDILDSGWE